MVNIYKKKDIVTDIKVTGVNIGNIGAKFYTEDENTAEITMTIKHNGAPFDLNSTTMKPKIYLFMRDGSIFDNEVVDVVDAAAGLIKIDLSVRVIKHVGKVDAKLFLWSESESVHVADFQFEIVDSGIESIVAKEIDINILDSAIMEVINANPSMFKGEKGDVGEQGPQGEKGDKGDGLQIDGVVATVGELPTGTTKSTYLVGTTLYFRNTGSNTWTKGSSIKGVDGKAGSVVTITSDGYWAIDGVKQNVKAYESTGNRNYVMQSDFKETGLPTSWQIINGGHTGVAKIVDDEKFGKVYKHELIKVVSSDTPFSVTVMKLTKNLNAGGTYTIRMYLRADEPTIVDRIQLSEVTGTRGSGSVQRGQVTTEWKLFEFKSTLTSTQTATHVYLGVCRDSTAKSIYVAEPMVVDGQALPLSYEPAFEDSYGRYALTGHNHDLTYSKIGSSYTKSESDNKYALKNSSYTKDEANATFVSSGTSYTKAESDAKYELKGSSSVDLSSYMKTVDADAKYALKSDIASGATVDMTAYSTTAQADAKYALKSHVHAISEITGLQSALDGKASTSHTHTTSQISGLYTTLANKANVVHNHDTVYAKISSVYTKAEVDNLISGSSGGSQPITSDTLIIDVEKSFGLVGDNTTNNYAAIKKWRDHANTNPGSIYFLRKKDYRSSEYKQIKNIDGAVVDGTVDDIIWTCKDITILGNGAKFISMPMTGFTKTPTYENSAAWYTKEEHLTLFNFENCENLTINNLVVDGEVDKIKWATGVTTADGTNAKYNGKQIGEGRGHGIVIGGGRHITMNNVKSNNFSVDGLVIGFSRDWANYKMINAEFVTLKDCDFWYNGRLGASGLGAHATQAINCTFNYNGTKMFNAPAMGFDFEPHGSPLGADNLWHESLSSTGTTTKWRADKWNGNFKMIGGEIIGNRGGAIATTSTMLTRNVTFENTTIKAGNFPWPHYLITSALQNTEFINCDIDGTLANNQRSFVFPFAYGGSVSQPTGVLTANYANVKTVFKGGQHKNYDFWTNDDDNGTTVRNDVAAGEWGLHETFFEKMACTNVMWRYNHGRKSTMRDCQLVYTDDQSISYLNLWNAVVSDTAIISKKANSMILGFGSGTDLSQISNLQLTQGKFTFRGDAPYKTRTMTDELIEVYDRTTAMDYVLSRIGSGGTTTTTTTQSGTTTTTTTAAATTTTTTTSAPSVGNLWPTASFDFTGKTIPAAGGSGSKLALNSAYTISNNEAQALDVKGSGDTITITATAETAKYGFFTLQPNTQYTVRIKASDTVGNASDLVTMIGGDYIWPNPKVVDITFTTDANGRYGYDFNGVTYGAADATKGLFHRANGGKNSTTTYKIWLNKGSTSTATWSS